VNEGIRVPPGKGRDKRMLKIQRPVSYRGFTLVEIMVAAAILSLGIVAVYEGFFMSLEAFDRYTDFLNTSGQADEMIWKIEDTLARSGKIMLGDKEGILVSGGKEYLWNLRVNAVDVANGLYAVEITISQTSRSKKIATQKAAYVLR